MPEQRNAPESCRSTEARRDSTNETITNSSNNSNPARPYVIEGAQLSPDHLKLIVDSAIAPEIARDRRYRTISTKAELKRYRFSDRQCITPTLLVPLFGATGQRAGYQHRPDDPRVNKDGKPIKYETPTGARMVIDVHPLLSRKRVSKNPNALIPGEPLEQEGPPLIADPTIPLLITEGTRKADSAVSNGLCCIALLGVWNWRGTNDAGGKTALADWESIALNGRKVYVAFDSDVMEKREVYSALVRLKHFLESRAATLGMIYLPPGPHGEKIGLDDFIAVRQRNRLSDEKIRGELFDLATEELRPPPIDKPETQHILQIDITGKRLRDLTAEAVSAIESVNKAQPRFFQQGGVLVRLRKDHGYGAPRVEAITPDALRGELDRIADWTATSTQTGGPRQTDPPIRVVKDVLALPGFPVPPLDAVVSAPFFTTSGELIMQPNYNADAQLFLYLDSGLRIPPVSRSPADAEVAEAKKLILEEVLGDFPFAREADIAHAVGAMVYPPVRKMIDAPSPLHAFEAPKPGSGKGLLVSTITMINVGCSAEVISESRDEPELRKQITSLLLDGTSVVLFDNVRRKINSGSFAALLTADVWKDRILGISRMVAIPNRTLWFITGNNLRFSDEMVRRTVPIRLDAQVEDPSQRTGFRHADLLSWVRDNRSKLIWAQLTLAQNWIARGRKPFRDRTLGSYERWAQVIGGILGAAGISGFLEGREDFRRRADEEADAWARFVDSWYQQYGRVVLTVDDLLELALAELGSLLDDGKLEGEAGDRALRTRLGRMLSKRRDWVIADHKLVADSCHDSKSRARAGWRLAEAPQEQGQTPHPPQSHARDAHSRWDVGKEEPAHERFPTRSASFESPNMSEDGQTRMNHLGKNNPLNLDENFHQPERPNSDSYPSRASAEEGGIDLLADQEVDGGKDDCDRF